MENMFCELPQFEKAKFQIKYNQTTRNTVVEGGDQHIHNECEIYINISGDVSFMVEDTIYPISKGSVIITRPYEYHHCIYNSDEPHEHYWILFSSTGNEKLLKLFFERDVGKNNLLVLDHDNTDRLFELCKEMCQNDNLSNIAKAANFFTLISILEKGTAPNVKNNIAKRDLRNALYYINTNFTRAINITQIAKLNNMSVNTLERKFLKALNMTPSAYIKQKRLANAVKLLSKGESVTEAALKSGFPDCSAFITLFKKQYGMTPLKYKQKNER